MTTFQEDEFADSTGDESKRDELLTTGSGFAAAICRHTSDLLVQIDSNGRVLYMNPAARSAFGVNDETLPVSLPSESFFTHETDLQFRDEIVPALADRAVWHGESTIRLTGTSVAVRHVVMASRNDRSEVICYTSVMNVKLPTTLSGQDMHQADILRSVTEAIPATVVIVGIDGRYRFVNKAFENYCGLERDRIIGRKASDILSEGEIARRTPWMKRAFAGEVVEFVLDYPSPVGTTFQSFTCVPLRSPAGEFDGFVGIGNDITQQRMQEERLTSLAHRDPLTHLLNRTGLDAAADALIQNTGSAGLAVMYMDLDSFKPVNDLHGHPVGDALLHAFSARLRSNLRPGDVVARLGGDEFAVVLAGLQKVEHAEAIAKKLIAAAQKPFEIGGLVLTVGLSIGLAYSGEQLPVWRQLLAQADSQLLRAKASGKGGYAL